MYGWTRQEVMGRNVSEILYSDPKKFEEANRLTLSESQWQGELQHLTRDKSEISVEARWTLIRDGEGRQNLYSRSTPTLRIKKRLKLSLCGRSVWRALVLWPAASLMTSITFWRRLYFQSTFSKPYQTILGLRRFWRLLT